MRRFFYLCAFAFLFFSCSPETYVIVTTLAPEDVTQTSAKLKARITLSDNFNVIYGFCWSDHPRPVMPIMIEDKVESAGRGVIEADITNLEAGTQYYVRAYAVMLSGTVYGNEISFTTADATDPY